MSDREIPMHSGDVALLYTDGMTEARPCGGDRSEVYGADRLQQEFAVIRKTGLEKEWV